MMRGHVTTESRESKEICRVLVWRLQAAVATTNNGSSAAANSWCSVRRDSMYNGVDTGLRDLVDKCHYRDVAARLPVDLDSSIRKTW
jgi:hypothetical protein